MAKLDLAKYSAMVANAASQVKISSTIFKNFIADVKAVVDGNDDILNNKANKNQGALVLATLQNGWTGAISYAKNDLGLVTLRVNITAGTVADNTQISSLPSGYFVNTLSVVLPVAGLNDGKIRHIAVLGNGNISTIVGNIFVAGHTYQGEVAYYVAP